MKVNVVFASFFVFFLLSKASQQPKVDWDKAYAHAKAGKTVSLKVVDAVPPDEMQVLIIDGDNEYPVAFAMSFPKGSKATFLFDLSQTLRKLSEAPTSEAKIVIKGATYRRLEINLR